MPRPPASSQDYAAAEDMSYLKESTVFVVSVNAMNEFFADFEVRPEYLRGL